MMNRFLTLLAVLLSFPVLAQTASRTIEADRVVAVVNDDVITLFELRFRLANVERQLRSQNTQLPPREVMERQMLERMIVDRVQTQFARETGIQVSDAELDGAMRRIAESNNLALPAFRAALERDGIAWGRFREEIRDEITTTRLREREVEARVAVSDGEIDNYLANLANGGNNATMVTLAHILIRAPEQATPEQLARLRTKAETALNQLKGGDDFARAAATYSDSNDALSGGVISARPLDRLPTLYSDAAQQLEPGQVSGILQSPAGFHIVKLVDRRGGALSLPPIRQTHARHILIRTTELVSDNEARQKLVVLRDRIEHGADFAELARLNSNDLSAARGGDLDWVNQGATVPEFEKAMDALKIGEVSQPIKSPFGWHLIQVMERRTDEGSDERKRLAARQAIRERKADEAYQDWLRQLRDRAYVEIKLEDR